MSLAVLCGGLLVGSLISLASGKLGLPFVLCFIIGVVFSVLLTEPRSLFLSVVSIPIFFSIAAGATGWFLNQQISRPNGSGGISKTQILSAIYPLLQQFPVMAIATIGAGIIAYLRWHLVTRYVQQSEKKAAEDRRRDTETQKRAMKQANRVRTAAHNTAEPADEPEQTSGPAHPPSTGSITVAELIKRNQRAAQKGQRRRTEPPKPATPASAKPAPAQASRQQSSRQQPSSRSAHASNRPAGTPRSSAASGTHSAASQASQASTGQRAARQAGHQANRQSTQQPQKRTQRTQRTGQPAQRRAATPNQPASRRAATTSNGSRSSRQDRQNPRQDHHDPQKSTGSTPPKPRVRRRRALNDDLYS